MNIVTMLKLEHLRNLLWLKMQVNRTPQAVLDVYPVCECGVQQVSSLSVDQSFGLPRAAWCIKHEQDVLTVHGRWLTNHVLLQHLLHNTVDFKDYLLKNTVRNCIIVMEAQ